METMMMTMTKEKTVHLYEFLHEVVVVLFLLKSVICAFVCAHFNGIGMLLANN